MFHDASSDCAPSHHPPLVKSAMIFFGFFFFLAKKKREKTGEGNVAAYRRSGPARWRGAGLPPSSMKTRFLVCFSHTRPSSVASRPLKGARMCACARVTRAINTEREKGKKKSSDLQPRGRLFFFFFWSLNFLNSPR